MSNELVPTGTREISEAQQTVFTQSTPPEVIKTRPGPGGKRLSYVEHGWVTKQLNLAFNWAWSWRVLDWKVIPDMETAAEVFVLGELAVHTPHGDLIKTQFGTSDVKRTKQGSIISIGDDLKAASSDALKKCASLLGLALDLYTSDDGHGPVRTKARRQLRPADPVVGAAQDLGGVVAESTPKSFAPTNATELYTLAQSELGISPKDASQTLIGWLQENHATSNIGAYIKAGGTEALGTLWQVLEKSV